MEHYKSSTELINHGCFISQGSPQRPDLTPLIRRKCPLVTHSSASQLYHIRPFCETTLDKGPNRNRIVNCEAFDAYPLIIRRFPFPVIQGTFCLYDRKLMINCSTPSCIIQRRSLILSSFDVKFIHHRSFRKYPLCR